MRILHIINTLETGGAQSVLAQLIENWGEGQEKQLIVSLTNHEQEPGRFEALKTPIKFLNMRPGQFNLMEFLKLIGTILSFNPDAIQTWLYHSDLLGSIATRLAHKNLPIVWGIHHTTTNQQSVKLSTWRTIKLLSKISHYIPSKIVCCSDSAYQTHLSLGYDQNKMLVIPNGVNVKKFKPDLSARETLRQELELSSSTSLIGMFARFHPQKDHITFLLAAGILLRQGYDVHFVLAGDGVDPSNTYLKKIISKEKMKGYIHLLGKRQDMPQLNAGLDIATLSSAYGEALPMSLCEAMSCGIPCVATNIGDTQSLLGNTGLVVKPNNPQALADGWSKILELPSTEYIQLGIQAQKRIATFYNGENMALTYKNMFKELTTRNVRK